MKPGLSSPPSGAIVRRALPGQYTPKRARLRGLVSEGPDLVRGYCVNSAFASNAPKNAALSVSAMPAGGVFGVRDAAGPSTR